MEIRSVLRFTLSGSKADVSVAFEHVCFDTVDANRFCAATNNKIVYFGDVAHNKIKFLHKLDSQCVAICMIQKVDGAEVAIIGQSDGSIIVVDIETGRVLSTNPGVGEPFHHISTHPSADRVVTSYKSSAIVWNVTDDVLPVQRLKISETADLLQATFGFDGSSIVTCFCDGRIIIWDFPSLGFKSQLENVPFLVEHDELATTPLITATISRDGKYLAATGKHPIIIIWDLIHNGSNPKVFDLSEAFTDMKQIEFLSSSEESMIVICLGVDGSLRCFDVLAKAEIKSSRKSKSDRKYTKIIAVRQSKNKLYTLGALDTTGSLDILNLLTSFKKLPSKQKISTKSTVDLVTKIPVVKPKPIELEEETASKTPDLDIVSVKQLEDILKTFGEFPNKYRFIIWRYALKLPKNKLAFATLLDRGIHPVFQNLEDTFDVSDEGLLSDLKKILSAVAYWCSLFAEVNYLPLFVFPFVKVLRHDLLTCFEVILTCIVNFCHNWFEYFPAPPFSVLADIDMLLKKDSPSLLEHFNLKGVTAQVYAWPLLKTFFSEVFTQDEWLKIWDHIVLYKNDRFLLTIAAAYSIISQHTLVACQEETDCKRYFREKNPIPIKPLLEKALKLLDFAVTPGTLKAHTFKPLSKETYPIFYNFPHAVVENHAKELRKIRELEADYLNQRKITLEIEAKYGSVIQQEEELRRKEAILKTAEVLRRQEIIEEDQRLAEQRSRLQVLTKELQDRELAILEAHRRSLSREKMVRKEEEINQLEDQLLFRSTLRESELRDAVEKAEMRKLRILADSCCLNADVMEGCLDSRETVNYLAERYENGGRVALSSSSSSSDI